jgi:hypothetical protein
MMSKIAIAPSIAMKDLFVEEMLMMNPNPKQASDAASNLLKIIMEVCN